MNRRAFLRTLGTAGTALATAPAVATTLIARDAAAASGEQLATLYDLSKCVGCGSCVAACRDAHAADYPEPKKPFPKMYPARVKAEDFSDKRDLDTRLTPYNWLFIQSATVSRNGAPVTVNMPRRCMHCTHPPCVELCPWGSAVRHADGAVAIDASICLGGSKCRTVCPWAIPQRQTGVGLYLDLLPAFAGNGVMYKCDRCHSRVAAGGKPACLEACPYEVQTIGPRAEIIAAAHAMAKSIGGFIYGETENGGTNTLYVSPVPFADLNAALKTGPGQPGLHAAADVMGKEQNLATAVLMAPIAGIAAGLLRLAGRFKNAAPKEDDHA
ncbi:4Fe-4S dicluster domain-containing protein [Desulfovibrio sp. TomC]|uniref:4Fe-4S dicluster domain-containing protein n=1 Tax=Desulfovibrio sp. TomC TaxID=1562888 RepID=UPI000573518C|nr:4Fe-4S dicluster domain-containing protein [Desulfovibrio sp. TomC]KHK03661.1 Formate dehydrogenase O beta subunit [Desulfovibrio sp. TomC]